ncbi:MAG TPA: MFS transporter, partial [Acetobacteraceae bacterium]
MNSCIACPGPAPRLTLSNTAMTAASVVTAMTFSASGAAPTPLYPQYQESFGLLPFMVTLVFAAYVLSLLAALLTVGSLSDHVGRRPAILAALLLNIAAMVMFMTADSALTLIAARSVQGFATGLAAATLGAAILDTDRRRGPVLNSVTAFAGLTVGSLGAGVLVTFAPFPDQLVYLALLMLSAIELLVLWHMPETARPKPGALASLRPHVSVPARARGPLARLMPLTIASWALGGFYFSLMPSLVRVATGVTLPVLGGLVVSALTFSATLTVLALRAVPAHRLLRGSIAALASGVALTLAGVQAQLVSLMLAGAIVSGSGLGAALSATLRTVLPLAGNDERAGLLSAFYVEGYLSFSLPAMLAGSLVPVIGLTAATDIYGLAVIATALASAPVIMLRPSLVSPATTRSPACGTPGPGTSART